MEASAAPLFILLVALGGAIGGVARYRLAGAIDGRWRGSFPAGILVVNVSGAFAIGALAGLLPGLGRATGDVHAWTFLVVGVLGSFTTVSSFSLNTLDLARSGRPGLAAVNVAASVLLCTLAAAAGVVAARLLGAN